MYLKDDKGAKSQTITLVWVGLITASLKLFLAGGKFWGMEFGEFSGSDYALVISPFLALLAHKKQVAAKSSAKLSSEQKDAQG